MSGEAKHTPGPKVLTVIIRDVSPFMHLQEPPTYRSVQIELTPEQREKLSLAWVASSGFTDYHEEVSQCFFEPLPQPPEQESDDE